MAEVIGSIPIAPTTADRFRTGGVTGTRKDVGLCAVRRHIAELVRQVSAPAAQSSNPLGERSHSWVAHGFGADTRLQAGRNLH